MRHCFKKPGVQVQKKQESGSLRLVKFSGSNITGPRVITSDVTVIHSSAWINIIILRFNSVAVARNDKVM